MNLVKILDKYALAQGNHIALKDHFRGLDRALTYRQLHARTQETAGRLIQLGVRMDQRVLVAVPLSIETYILLLAIFRIGAVAVIADSSSGVETLCRSIAYVEPDAIVTKRGLRLLGGAFTEVRKIGLKVDVDRVVSRVGMPSFLSQAGRPSENQESYQLANRLAAYIQDVDDEHPALITFTSGSTGQPKAIVRSHGFLLQQQMVIADSMPAGKNDVELTTLPVFVLSALARGITSVLPDCNMAKPGSVAASRIIQQLKRCNVNRIIAAPAFLQNLCEYLCNRKQKLPQLKDIFTGGGPVFPALLKSMETAFPNAELTAVYGSTEAEPIAHIKRGQLTKEDFEKAISGAGLPAGKPIANIELAIVDPAQLDGSGEQFPTLPAFEAGEILVAGKHVIKTYLNGQGNSETKVVVKTGDQIKVWHRTGDAGYLDEKGRLWLLGRSSSRISDQWGNLYPFQVEVAASEIRAVERATCLQSDGKRILVVEKKHFSPMSMLAEFLKPAQSFTSTISDAFSWLHFDELRLVHSIPVDIRHNSKIQYSILAKRLSQPWRAGIARQRPA